MESKLLLLLLWMIGGLTPQMNSTTITPTTTPTPAPASTQTQTTIQAPTTIPTPEPLYPISGFTTQRALDGSSPQIILQRPFVYFGTSYNQIFVNHNGHFTFTGPWSLYTPQRIPLHGSRDFIAPFWTDFDNRVSGLVYYNQFTNGSILQQATQDINEYFPELNFTATWVFVATWHEMAYYPNTGTKTTVQAVLISGGQYSFVLMNYGIIAQNAWNVQVGYDTVNSTYYLSVPGSFTNNASGNYSVFRLNSNVNVPGRWAFRVDHRAETPTCPSNSHYEFCGTSCPLTCMNRFLSFPCFAQCLEGCQCDDGFVLNGSQCVPLASCGCSYQGLHRQNGEQFCDGDNCQNLCTCNGTTGAVKCFVNSQGPLYEIVGNTSSHSDDGSSPQILLLHPFVYFGRSYSQIYVNHNGHLTFEAPWSSYVPQRFPMNGTRDIIAPFWTDLNNAVNGDIYYAQFTSGHLLQQVTQDINEYFPYLKFSAKWIFMATWYGVAYFSNPGSQTTFQAVLTTDGKDSFVLMNYGNLDPTSRSIQAGYDTINSTEYFILPGSFSSNATGNNSVFSHNSNINVPGRWVFRVTHGSAGPLYEIAGTTSSHSDDGSSPQIQLLHPLDYFGQSYTQIYVNHNGHLTFQAPWFSYFPQRFPMNGTRDIIAPFWTDLNNAVSGDIYYAQHTSGQLLRQVTRDINEYLPELNFNAKLVFIATWDEVAYYSGPGTATFQAVLTTDGQYSFLLMNYGYLAPTTRPIQAGYDTVNSHHYFTIPGSFSSNATGNNSVFSLNSNVNVPGRWVFRVDLGCTFNDGSYYKVGESFWTDGCTQRCVCQGPNDLHCTPASCTPTQECTIRNGQLGCYDPMSTCTVMGDPHYITYDGALAHFQGTCSYVITESMRNNNNETQFSVVATNSHRGNNRVSFVSSVDIYLSNQSDNVHVRIGPNIRVKVNGVEESLPTSAGSFGQVMRQGSYIVFDAVDFKVQFDGRSTLLVRIGQHYQNRVTGMCGNFNGDPTDDKVLPNGTLAQNDNHFGLSWKSNTSQAGCGSTDDGSGDGLSDCQFIEEYTELCRVITNTSGPFSSCHLHSNPQPFFTSCVYDLCLYTPANGMLCSVVSAYERTCSVLGLNISNWRSALLCDPCEELDCAEHEWCGQKDGVYGCFCDEHHQRPNNINYDSTTTCANSSGTLSLSRCQLFEAGFHSDALHLRDGSCNGTIQDGRLVFHFDNDNHPCGTVLKSNGSHFMYENTIQGSVDTHGGLISREKTIHLRFFCVYPLVQAVSMDVKVNPMESHLRKSLPVGRGSYSMRMIPYEDAEFQHPFTTNSDINIENDEMFYLEVRTEGVDQHQISTVLDSCWATPDNNANSSVRWDLIISECPNPADRTVELIQNGVSTVARFSFKMFTFNDFDEIYLHCNVHLCLLGSNSCTARCYPGNRTRFKRKVSYHDSAALSFGPLVPNLKGAMI